MSTLSPIPEKSRHLQKEIQQKKQQDAFQKQIDKHQKSKTDNLLNLIYSILVGIFSGVLSKRHIKYSKTLGLLIAISSYLISKKASKVSIQ